MARNAGLLIPLILTLVLASCSRTRTVVTSVYEDHVTSVALHRVLDADSISPRKGYSHPVGFEPEDLKYYLSTLRFQEKGFLGWSDAKRVFTASELYRMTPHLVEAFAQATPNDEVHFRLSGARTGAPLTTEHITSGSMFVQDGKLNCLFANICVRPDIMGKYNENTMKNYTGALWRLVARESQGLVKGEQGLHYNWIELDYHSLLEARQRSERLFREGVERAHKRRSIQKREKAPWEDWTPEKGADDAWEDDVYFPPEE